MALWKRQRIISYRRISTEESPLKVVCLLVNASISTQVSDALANRPLADVALDEQATPQSAAMALDGVAYVTAGKAFKAVHAA